MPKEALAAASIGRYVLHSTIGSGGMASVFLATMTDSLGFRRTVAVKRLHPHFARDPHFVQMFLDEARLAMRVRHSNVVSTLEAVAADGEVFLVMDYVVGESLGVLFETLRASGRALPPRIASSLLAGALAGMHAAHEAADEAGQPLAIVHRDVSPQNILVGADGVARVLDFGVAKAAGQRHATEEGQIKGKLRYMAPEQLTGGDLDRRVDVCAAGIVLWEALTGRFLFDGANPGQIVSAVLTGDVRPPSELSPEVSPALDAVVLRALARNRDMRFATAREMAIALEAAAPPASMREVSDFVMDVLGPRLRAREVAAAATVQEASSGTPGAQAASPLGALGTLGTSDVPSDAAPSTAVRGALQELDTVLTTASTTIAMAAQPPPRRRGRTAVLVGLAMVSLGGALALALHPARAIVVAPDVPGSPSSVPVLAVLPVIAGPTRPASGLVPAPSVPSPIGPTEASADPTPPRVAPRPAPHPTSVAPKVGASQARPAPAARPDCRNPFSIDARGYRVPRPECFR